MSPLLAILFAIQAAAPGIPAEAGEPITVTASRLDSVLFNLSVNRMSGQMKCRVARSSGIAGIDAYMCNVARYCAEASPKKRAAIEQCIAERKKAFLARSR